jgi:hypothetical protein
MSKRLLQIAVLVVTVYFAVDVGQQTGWSPKAYVGALIAPDLTPVFHPAQARVPG